jgi:hypothetical protein
MASTPKNRTLRRFDGDRSKHLLLPFAAPYDRRVIDGAAPGRLLSDYGLAVVLYMNDVASIGH